MNIVYLIGNGFDVNVGLNTSYAEFYKWYIDQKSNSEHVRQFKKSIIDNEGIQLWADLEAFLGAESIKYARCEDFVEVVLDVNNSLRKYIALQNNRLTGIKDEAINVVKKNLIDPFVLLPNKTKRELNSFSGMWKSYSWGLDIITFNYTDVLERLLGEVGSGTRIDLGKNRFGNNVYLNSIKHIHGKCSSTILVGVDNDSQIANEEFRKNSQLRNCFIKPISNDSMESLIDEDCSEIISKAHFVCIYGCSLGITDETWWMKIRQRLKADDYGRLLILDYNSDYHLDGLEFTRRDKVDFVVNKFLSEGFEDLKKKIYVGLNTDIFNIKPFCTISGGDTPKKKNEANNNEPEMSTWGQLFAYDTLSNSDFEKMIDNVESNFSKGIIPPSFIEFVYAIVRLSEIDANVKTISSQFKNSIKSCLTKELSNCEDLEELKSKRIIFLQYINSAKLGKQGNDFFNEIKDYFNTQIEILQGKIKGNLINALDNVSDKTVNKLKDLLNEESYLGGQYSDVPVFDKVNVSSFTNSALKLSNKSRKVLCSFFRDRYMFDYSFKSNSFEKFNIEIDNLSSIITNISNRLSEYGGIDKVSISGLLDYIKKAKKRCEGDLSVLIN